MTQVANTTRSTDSSYYTSGGVFKTCQSCGLSYWDFGFGHLCNSLSPPLNPWPVYDWQPKTDPFVEFKKLYRNLILENLIERFEEALEDRYQDKIDKPVRKDLIDYLESLRMDIVDDEPRP